MTIQELEQREGRLLRQAIHATDPKQRKELLNQYDAVHHERMQAINSMCRDRAVAALTRPGNWHRQFCAGMLKRIEAIGQPRDTK